MPLTATPQTLQLTLGFRLKPGLGFSLSVNPGLGFSLGVKPGSRGFS
jgi:hypothetical protein